MLRSKISCLFVLGMAMASCSKEVQPPGPEAGIQPEAGPKTEAGPGPEAGGSDAGLLPGVCAGKADGTDCSPVDEEGQICLAGKCLSSSCGDKYLDSSLGEECDDGNAAPGDGCDGCKLGCKTSTDCDDQQLCSGVETCDPTAHKCLTGIPAKDGTPCTLATGKGGACRGGTCSPVGCGDKTVGAGEECDDGNLVDSDGCDANCTFSCKSDAECDDLDSCTGVETCNTAKHTCTSGAALDCDDKKPCTADSCDSQQGCVHAPIDLDGDAHSCDQDCNDNDATIYVGAPEGKDGKDNDCDGQVDETTTWSQSDCWVDQDGDGYAAVGAAKVSAPPYGSCLPGYTSRNPAVSGQADCRDTNASVHPKQTAFFTTSYCTTTPCYILKKSFDYSCDGLTELRYAVFHNVSAGCRYNSVTKTCQNAGWKQPVPFPISCPARHCCDGNVVVSCVGNGAGGIALYAFACWQYDIYQQCGWSGLASSSGHYGCNPSSYPNPGGSDPSGTYPRACSSVIDAALPDCGKQGKYIKCVPNGGACIPQEVTMTQECR